MTQPVPTQTQYQTRTAESIHKCLGPSVWRPDPTYQHSNPLIIYHSLFYLLTSPKSLSPVSLSPTPNTILFLPKSRSISTAKPMNQSLRCPVTLASGELVTSACLVLFLEVSPSLEPQILSLRSWLLSTPPSSSVLLHPPFYLTVVSSSLPLLSSSPSDSIAIANPVMSNQRCLRMGWVPSLALWFQHLKLIRWPLVLFD